MAGSEAARVLLDHVNRSLQGALRDREASHLNRSPEGAEGPDEVPSGPTPLWREPLLGITLCAPNRHDIKLDLRDAPVGEALAQV